VEVLYRRWAGLMVYFLGVAGTIFVVAKLSSLILVHTIVLASPLLESTPPRLSLIQQRRIDAALALPPSQDQATLHVAPSEVPTVPLAIYAAQLDVAEREDSTAVPQVAAFERESEPSSIATGPERLRRVAHLSGPKYTLTPADIFNRSFGVITVSFN
jgi:hypothetical protein